MQLSQPECWGSGTEPYQQGVILPIDMFHHWESESVCSSLPDVVRKMLGMEKEMPHAFPSLIFECPNCPNTQDTISSQ